MKKWLVILPLIALVVFLSTNFKSLSPSDKYHLDNPAVDNTCRACHGEIEHIMDPSSEMMQEIYKVAQKAGFEGNDCIVCHGGNPNGKTKEDIHDGTIAFFQENEGPKNFYPDPGSPWINEHTCGTCHSEQVKSQFASLMFTEAGKIQGSLWGFGGMNGYQHDIANHAVSEDAIHEKLGTQVYRDYVKELRASEKQVFPEKMKPLPAAPTKEEIEKNPELAVYTYMRQECQRCHTGSKGREKRGDFRGIGCSSCHVPYSNEGYYEGNDRSISKDAKGKPLVHSLQSTREVKVTVHEKEYSGIPVETCTTCHDRGKRIGTSFQGLMETAYGSPFGEKGNDQAKLHTKKYLHLHADVHMEKGMLCQDCHTSLDVHSDGLLSGTTLAPVEIECEDCHGTPEKYPWELPIGYGDEVHKHADQSPRGVTDELPEYLKMGTVYNAEDGYLLSARGNPLGNVVRDGDEITVHTAGGKDLKLQPLKKLNKEDLLSLEGRVAMVNVGKHMDKMECYSCHADWAPQCYGCHIKVDYSEGKQHPDWVAMAAAHDEHGLTAEARGEHAQYMIDGQVKETRSYLRWENPPLAVNGEHRISPAIPGCQTSVTVIGKDGDPLLLNHIFKIPHSEGAGEEGQLGIDISPVQPHTISKGSRSCESCHNNPVAMGYGIEGGKIYADPSQAYVVDLTTADGEVIPEKKQTQVNAIPNLEMDWSRFVDEEGNQLQTVGHHFSGSRPLNNEERNNLDRRGVCMSCHQEIPEGNLAVDLLHHVKEVTDKEYDTAGHNDLLNKIMNIGAWAQMIFVLIVGVVLGWIFRRLFTRKRT